MFKVRRSKFNVQNPHLAALLILFLATSSAAAQAPNLSEARELWSGQIDHQQLRLLQVPRNATALIPLRFVLEEVSAPSEPAHLHSSNGEECPACRAGANRASRSNPRLLDRIDRVEITAVEGPEARLSYVPRTTILHQWSDNVAEVRETFRTPGKYQLAFSSLDQSEINLAILIEVGPYRYIEFGQEFGFFVAGCILLGLVLAGIVYWLHQRGKRRSEI